MQSTVCIEKFPIEGGFTISRETKNDAITVFVELRRNGFAGTGECVPLKRYHHTAESVQTEIENWLDCAHEWSREVLLESLPAGPARFALDTAMWQLEAAEKKISFAQYAGFENAHMLRTAFTLSGAAPEAMAEKAAAHAEYRWLKTKLMGDGQDEARLRAIHDAVPHMELIVDANEGLTPEMLRTLMPVFQSCNVVLIEQPLPAGADDALHGFASPIPLAADESCHTIDDLPHLAGKYQVANLKLDKTGGLTHALEMKKQAQKLGLQIMIGCMASTSLSILPAFFLAQDAAFVDLDGALLLVKDRENSKLCYRSGQIFLIE